MQSNPAEIDGWWNPAGDDSAGYIYTQQTYDWKSRPLETRHLTDGAVRYASYVGCGCAGGDVVTLTDEAGRQQKVYSDAIGRQWKTEILNDGAIYSADVSVYNARDQITNTKQYSGQAAADASSTNPTASCPNGTCKESSTAYDGYGRIQSTHDAEQDAGAATVYAYNGDDTVSLVTDARGASASYLYNNYRGLVNSINYFSPSGVASTSNVSFTYDAAGNRSSMSDGTGSSTYSYDSLSRLQSETKQFSGPGAPSGSFTLAYDYNFANQVKSVTDQRSGTSFSNSYDNIGRVTSVSGVGYGGAVTPFASQMLYRASGALKSLTYGNSTTLSLGYNGRGLVTSYSDAMIGSTYQYYADGRVKFAHDRAYQYDHAGRIAEAYSGAEARDFVNNTNSGVADGPFRQTYVYDAWDNVLTESGRFWSRPELTDASYNSANRNTAWSYDAEGNVLSRNDGTSVFQAAQYGFDAAGRAVSSTQNSGYFSAEGGGLITQAASNSQGYDGDSQLVRAQDTLNISVNGSLRTSINETTYKLRSSALGGAVISEYNDQGVWQRTYVYAGSQRIGQQYKAENGTAFSTWRHVDPVTGDEVITTFAATMLGQTVLDPQGVDVGTSDPFPPDGSSDPNGIVTSQVSEKTSAGLLPIEGGGTKCVLDGIEMDCGFVSGGVGGGEASTHCPNNDCGPRVVWTDVTDTDGKTHSGGTLTEPFSSKSDGTSGFGFAGRLLPEGFSVTFSGSEVAAAILEFYSANFIGKRKRTRRATRGHSAIPRSEGNTAAGGGTFASGVNEMSRAFTVTGVAALGLRYYYVNGAETLWRGLDGVMHPVTGYHPNGATGARALAFEKAGVFKALGKTAGAIGIGISAYQAYNSFSQGNNQEGAKHTFDAIMGGVGFAGPVGAGVSTTYFVVDMTVGWPAVGRVVFSCDANCQYRANHYGMFAK